MKTNKPQAAQEDLKDVTELSDEELELVQGGQSYQQFSIYRAKLLNESGIKLNRYRIFETKM